MEVVYHSAEAISLPAHRTYLLDWLDRRQSNYVTVDLIVEQPGIAIVIHFFIHFHPTECTGRDFFPSGSCV